MFSIILNLIGTLLHFYVAQRLHRIKLIRAQVPAQAWWIGAVVVWLVYLIGLQLGRNDMGWRWLPEQFALTWLGLMLTMALPLLAADLLTGFGLWWRRYQPRLLALAAIGGVGLSAFAVWQGVRAPVVVEQEVVLRGLPPELDGTVLAMVTDLHLGAQRGAGWMRARVDQINALQPAAVLMVGDLVDNEPLGDPRLAQVLRNLHAPRGVWAVTGNHEFYGDVETTVAEFSAGGVHWLRNEKVELAPGLMLAGIEDVGRLLQHEGKVTRGLEHVLPQPARTATIVLAHIPASQLIDMAAARNASLMLSGHTHGGQLWPFSYLVRQRFPYIVGQHAIGPMTLIVSRGAGSWGPRMRLWQPGEIVKMTLRAPR